MHAKIKDYIEIIEKVARVEHKRIPTHMVDYDELVSIGIIAIQVMIKGKSEEELAKYNNAYIATAVRWAIRNELRIRVGKNNDKELKEILEKYEEAYHRSCLKIEEYLEFELEKLDLNHKD